MSSMAFGLSLRFPHSYACVMDVTRPGKSTGTAHSDHRPSLDRLREFLEVTRAGSISEAARRLGLPRATLSRRIASLEADLGVRLLIRRTTRLALTRPGEELLKRAQRVVVDADAAWEAVRRLDDIPRGLLRVSVTGPHFLQLFTDFLRDFPEVILEVQSTTRHVDLLAEGVDVAMRIGPIRDQDLIARQVYSDRLIVVASSEYLDRAGRPARAADLTRHDCIVGFAGEWAPSARWPRWGGGTVPVAGRFSANEIEHIREAAIEGIGCALIASAVVAEDIETGRLVPILEDEVGAELPVSLVYADREFIDPKVREFVDRAVRVIASDLPSPLGLRERRASEGPE
ncbi:MAG: LysR family transcriptional regulator [Boseongicola sp.]|nr:LysR family transcriptional regulator [Boseongicola sp.]